MYNIFAILQDIESILSTSGTTQSFSVLCADAASDQEEEDSEDHLHQLPSFSEQSWTLRLNSVASQTEPLLKMLVREKQAAIDIPASKVRSVGIDCKIRLKTTTRGTQTASVETCDVGIQSKLKSHVTYESDELEEDDEEDTDNVDKDATYVQSSEEEEDDVEDNNHKSQTVHDTGESLSERKFIVFESMLLSLFAICHVCLSSTTAVVKFTVGSLVGIEQRCSSCAFYRLWRSQPYIGSYPAGNINMSSAILFSGSSARKVLRMFSIFNIAHISSRTFSRHQSAVLFPAVNTFWSQKQSMLLDEINSRDTELVLGGDGRADSPGHSAKYGSYSIVDLHTNQVVHVQLVQSNEVKSSYHMELEGLKRSLEYLTSRDVSVYRLVTDRHAQVAKWLRENYSEIDHRYDVWHVGKSVSKKLDKAAKYADCGIISEWTKSVINHMYWSACSTEDGSADEILAKWQSVINHIHNVHTGHSDLFPSCQHDSNATVRTKWIKSGTKASSRIETIVLAKTLLRDIGKLSPAEQTFPVEAYHSVINYFAPKLLVFSYHGMLVRLLLAALHYNENAQRKQATTRAGILRFAIKYPKYKKGGYSVRVVRRESTFDYVQHLLVAVAKLCTSSNCDVDNLPNVEAPPPLSASCTKPNKETAVREHMSRFSL